MGFFQRRVIHLDARVAFSMWPINYLSIHFRARSFKTTKLDSPTRKESFARVYFDLSMIIREGDASDEEGGGTGASFRDDLNRQDQFRGSPKDFVKAAAARKRRAKSFKQQQ